MMQDHAYGVPSSSQPATRRPSTVLTSPRDSRRLVAQRKNNHHRESEHRDGCQHKQGKQNVFDHGLSRLRKAMTQDHAYGVPSSTPCQGKAKRQICHSAARFRARFDQSE
jgi:hypothetical protein